MYKAQTAHYVTMHNHASMLLSCNNLTSKLISRYFSMACDRSVNRLVQVDCQNFLSTGLLQVVSACCNKKPFMKCNFMKLTSVGQVVDKLQQAGKNDIKLGQLATSLWHFGCVGQYIINWY